MKDMVKVLLAEHSPGLVRAADMPWIDTGGGRAFRPLRFESDGWSELMRLEPGVVVARHRHTGESHGFNLQGTRKLLATGDIVGAGTYVYEPAGNVDSWAAVGELACVIHFKLTGAVEWLDDAGNVIGVANCATQRQAYLDWCEESGRKPDSQLFG